MEKIQIALDQSEKKMELMVTTPQTLMKDTPNENGEKPCNRGREDDKTKEEEVGKSTLQIDPRLD